MNRFWQQLAIATNWPILYSVAVLTTIGCISIAAVPDTPRHNGIVHNQLVFICIGITGLVVMQWINYARVARWSWGFYIVSLLMVIYTVMPGVPRSGFGSVPIINGAHAWIDLRLLHLEPAELTKLAFCMVMARYLRFRSNYRTLIGLAPPFLLALGPFMLILLQPALGMALLFLPTLFVMLFAAGAKVKHLLSVLAMGLLLLPVVWLAGTKAPFFKHLPPLLIGYQRARIEALFNANPNNAFHTDFQREEALTAFSSGGFAGKGAGHIPIGAHVPEAHTDMIIALIGEQFGLVGVSIVLAAYLVLFAAGIEIAAATKEPFGRLLAVGIVAMLTAQTFLNLLVCLRLAPVTGITLPFVSFGGSSLLASFLAAGLLLNIGQNRPLVIARSSFEFD
jgi:cell division protein FtsW (lipid II flippase)